MLQILIMTNKYSWQNWDERESLDNQEIQIMNVWIIEVCCVSHVTLYIFAPERNGEITCGTQSCFCELHVDSIRSMLATLNTIKRTQLLTEYNKLPLQLINKTLFHIWWYHFYPDMCDVIFDIILNLLVYHWYNFRSSLKIFSYLQKSSVTFLDFWKMCGNIKCFQNSKSCLKAAQILCGLQTTFGVS